LFNLDRAVEDGRIKKGDYIVTFTAAIGFSWVSAVLRY
jgi:3-oxoacyl-[acyl-carrier-protein] synthase III